MTESVEKVRAAFPQCVEIANEFRAVFGPEIKMTSAAEGEYRAGRPLDESRYQVITGRDLIVATPKEEAHGR